MRLIEEYQLVNYTGKGRPRPVLPRHSEGKGSCSNRHLTSAVSARKCSPKLEFTRQIAQTALICWPNRGLFVAATPEEKQHARKVVRRLSRNYPDAECSLDFQTPLQLLIATILAAQCTDERVNRVTPALFRKYPTAADYASARPAELKKDIKSTGFYNNKAKSIQGCCRAMVERYGGEVPEVIDKLVELPGVGRKTANVVLAAAYGIVSGVIVDTHVGRISRRLGLSARKDAEKIEADLMARLPKKEWIAFSHRVVQHGRTTCTSRKPKCRDCTLADICPRIGVQTT